VTDRVAITPGSGDYVLTDQVNHPTFGQGQAQVIKLADGAPDGVVTIGADGDGGSTTVGALRASADRCTQATASSVTVITSSTTLLASNAGRRGAMVSNVGSSTVYVRFGGTASTSTYSFQLGPGQTYEMPARPIFTGVINAVVSTGSGTVMATEFTN
jgi:hypothetical protein